MLWKYSSNLCCINSTFLIILERKFMVVTFHDTLIFWRKFSLLGVPDVVEVVSGAAIDQYFVKVTIFWFQCLYVRWAIFLQISRISARVKCYITSRPHEFLFIYLPRQNYRSPFWPIVSLSMVSHIRKMLFCVFRAQGYWLWFHITDTGVYCMPLNPGNVLGKTRWEPLHL